MRSRQGSPTPFLGGVLRFALVFPRLHPVVGDPRLAALAWLLPTVILVAVAVAAGLAGGRPSSRPVHGQGR